MYVQRELWMRARTADRARAGPRASRAGRHSTRKIEPRGSTLDQHRARGHPRLEAANVRQSKQGRWTNTRTGQQGKTLMMMIILLLMMITCEPQVVSAWRGHFWQQDSQTREGLFGQVGFAYTHRHTIGEQTSGEQTGRTQPRGPRWPTRTTSNVRGKKWPAKNTQLGCQSATSQPVSQHKEESH